MPDFIHARGTFYSIDVETESEYVGEDEDSVLSFDKASYPEQVNVDGVTVCYQSNDRSVAERFSEWLRSGG